ncbi:MAG: PAS-domain containing protein [Devosia sp.]|uniref:sensor histidine kinase n=1 Tax=Devosia sp. TaxID=1871048 RepID=UPI001A42BBE7|nr:PAS domain-containing sensor histidine kinase [Devosia sp.]MBL8600119.1 PAS-domain containing protein [Devosia sp.]MCC6775125.1 PAS-domain containing protein [Hyphomicrobiales bacterium]
MRPDGFRKRLGFALCGAASLTLLTAAPALAQGLSSSSLMNAIPLAIAVGAGAFALLATAVVRRIMREGKHAQQRSSEQVASLRALVDDYEALLSSTGEVTIVWSGRATPKFFGPASSILPAGRRVEGVLDFASWLSPTDAEALAQRVADLRAGGQGFDLLFTARDGRQMRAMGWALGGRIALRLRPTLYQPGDRVPNRGDDLERVIGTLPDPVVLFGPGGKVVFANAAYQALARSTQGTPSEIADANGLELVSLDLPVGKAAYLRVRPGTAIRTAPIPAPAPDGLAHLSAIIDALATPIAIFNAGRELVQCNRAYAQLWRLDPKWLRQGMDERAILDKLRTDGMLPAEPDYQAWRARHLQSYTLKTPRESDPWHLPDGRTVQVISAPAGPKGGVIYVFEDITDQLKLKSQHRTQLDVQRSTLNALNEGVAVFGTNGRLTLANPRLSTLWRLPTNLLDTNPHIDQIVEAVARALPEDGAILWRDLKRSIVDLNPTRTDTHGRITRADGKMLDYAITRLPDGQTMMTFVDVTESANYQNVLKERNEALVTADRLKDAFVQNVSYELRSPLTNIIGFADLLASEAAGPLTDKQKSYTDYIRASSVTLGVLIDNILDLATVDAGIAQMRPEPQDVPALIEKAKAGLAATFPDIDGEEPLNIEIDIPEELPVLYADGTRIVQILYNLLSTAARFTEPGGKVRLSVIPRGERMIFTVEDDGTQMTDEMRAALSDRSDAAATSARQRGAGLGLAIVRSFVHLHGGTISVERREPRGSRVVVSLPLAAALTTAAE